MPIHFPFGIGLLRAVVSFGFLSCVLTGQTLCGQTATGEHPLVTKSAESVLWKHLVECGNGQSALSNESDLLLFDSANSGLTKRGEKGAPDEFDVTVEDEDSLKIFSVDNQQRLFVSNRISFGQQIASRVTRSTRASNSLPLLE